MTFDCGDNSCRYAPKPRGGMRTNGGCRCDSCPMCGQHLRFGREHREWCSDKTWRSPWQRIAEKEGT